MAINPDFRDLVAALNAAGARYLTEADLAAPGLVFQIGIAPSRIDIETTIDGVDFSDAWPAKMTTTYGDQTIAVIGGTHLIANKRATGRPQDRVDADRLERA